MRIVVVGGGWAGCAAALSACKQGAEVVLISASISVHPPMGVEVVPVQTAAEMRDAVLRESTHADALIMAAAVADYRPESASREKIKRKDDTLNLVLTKTSDIVGEVSGDLLKVGFAAESSNLIENARAKLASKGLDLIVANDITTTEAGFGVETNRVVLIQQDGSTESLPLMTKAAVAETVLERATGLLAANG